jgi:hypothetical protein
MTEAAPIDLGLRRSAAASSGAVSSPDTFHVHADDDGSVVFVTSHDDRAVTMAGS